MLGVSSFRREAGDLGAVWCLYDAQESRRNAQTTVMQISPPVNSRDIDLQLAESRKKDEHLTD